MAAPPKIPRAPGGCHSGRVFVKRSGSMSESWVSSRTFSMLDCEWSMGGGRMSVAMLKCSLYGMESSVNVNQCQRQCLKVRVQEF